MSSTTVAYKPFKIQRGISILGILLFGVIINFSIEVVFGLIYRNYTLFQKLWTYATTAGLTLIAFTLLQLINKKWSKWLPWDKQPLLRFAIQGGSNILFVVLFVLAIKVLWAFQNIQSTYYSFSDTLIILGVVVAFTFGYIFIDLSTYLLINWQKSMVEVEKFKKESIAFRYAMLRTQINPHFLFNSLNTLSSLIYADQNLASDYTRQLSRVYRYVLQNRDTDKIELNEELNILKDYMHILELRFNENLSFTIDISEEAKSRMVAPLSLQMLIENAIKHNVISSKKKLNIRISSPSSDYLLVANNINRRAATENSNEIGLSNIKSRFGYLTDAPVVVTDDEQYFTVKIPLITAK